MSYHEAIEVDVHPCSRCGHRSFRRVARRGILASVLVLFRLYPWECESCQHRTYSRQRDAHSRTTPLHERAAG